MEVFALIASYFLYVYFLPFFNKHNLFTIYFINNINFNLCFTLATFLTQPLTRNLYFTSADQLS